MASEVAIILLEQCPDEGKNILNQLGEAAKKTALGGADVLSNIMGEIKEGFKQKKYQKIQLDI